jgi:hypothetical protein
MAAHHSCDSKVNANIGKVLHAAVDRGADALPPDAALQRAIRMQHLFQLR